MKNTLLLASLAVLASACATAPAPMMFDNMSLLDAMRAPADYVFYGL
jgi:starvation-inducible outer membrane lipoprotein